MKISTLIIGTVLGLSLGVTHAEVALERDDGSLAAENPAIKTPPLLLVQVLPGMGVNPAANPVHRLPGMAVPAPAVALPQPVITELTNYPNPFDSRKVGLEGQTALSYQLAKDAQVSIDLYDLLGQKVRVWDFAPGINGGRQGPNLVYWDGTNAAGQKVSKGGYLAQISIETPETTVTAVRKIAVIH